MWKSPKLAVGPGERNRKCGAGSMAHRKGLLSAKVGAFLGGVLLLAVLMAGRVVVLNQMTTMRTNIAVLEDQKKFLETRSASLLARWNHETSATVICARAERELGLIRPAEPGLVLVKLPASEGKSRWGWPSWLEGFAGGDPAQASEFRPRIPDGAMVYLNPAANDARPSREPVQ